METKNSIASHQTCLFSSHWTRKMAYIHITSYNYIVIGKELDNSWHGPNAGPHKQSQTVDQLLRNRWVSIENGLPLFNWRSAKNKRRPTSPAPESQAHLHHVEAYWEGLSWSKEIWWCQIYIYIKNYQNMLNIQNEIRKEDKMNLSYLWDRGPCLQTTSKPKIPLESMHLGQQDCKTNLQTMTNWMLIGCSLHVRCMCIACSSHVQGMVIKCSSHVHCMFVAYSLVIVGWYCLHVLQTSRCAILMCFLRHKQSQCGHCQAMPPNGNLDTEKTH